MVCGVRRTDIMVDFSQTSFAIDMTRLCSVRGQGRGRKRPSLVRIATNVPALLRPSRRPLLPRPTAPLSVRPTRAGRPKRPHTRSVRRRSGPRPAAMSTRTRSLNKHGARRSKRSRGRLTVGSGIRTLPDTRPGSLRTTMVGTAATRVWKATGPTDARLRRLKSERRRGHGTRIRSGTQTATGPNTADVGRTASWACGRPTTEGRGRVNSSRRRSRRSIRPSSRSKSRRAGSISRGRSRAASTRTTVLSTTCVSSIRPSVRFPD